MLMSVRVPLGRVPREKCLWNRRVHVVDQPDILNNIPSKWHWTSEEDSCRVQDFTAEQRDAVPVAIGRGVMRFPEQQGFASLLGDRLNGRSLIMVVQCYSRPSFHLAILF
jgi:hypothetical protein